MSLSIPGAPELVQGLQAVGEVAGTDNIFDKPDPGFKWNPPLRLPEPGDPQGGISTYEVAISGDGAGLPIPFTPFTDDGFFISDCFDADGTRIDCDPVPVGPGDIIQITVSGDGVPAGLPDGVHQIKVRVKPQAGDPGDPVALVFTVDTTAPDAPVLLFPIAGVVLEEQSPQFSWNRVADLTAVTYTLQVDPGAFEFTEIEDEDPSTPDIVEFTIPEVLDRGVTYDWQVRTVDEALNEGDFSATENFSIRLPVGPPILSSPTGLISGDTPLFLWEEPAEGTPDSYRLQVALSGDLVTGPFPIDEQGLTDTRFQTPLEEALDDGRYDWHVIAIVSGVRATSDTASFSLDTQAPPAPVLLSPAQDAEVGPTPDFEWTQVEDPPFSGDLTYTWELATGHEPVLGIGGEFAEAIRRPDIPDVAVDGRIQFPFPVDEQPLTAGDYSWHVQGVDVLGNSGDFAPLNRFTILPGVDLLLEADPRVVGPGEEFVVTLVVSPDQQFVDAVNAFINFNTSDLEVVAIVPRTEVFEVVLLNTSDNTAGTIGYSASGDATNTRFALAEITFRAKDVLVSADAVIFFSNEDPRRTEATFDGLPVLRQARPTTVVILEPLVDLRLELLDGTGDPRSFRDLEGFARLDTFEVAVLVDHNGQSFTAVDALLRFDPSTLQVEAIRSGDDTPEELQDFLVRFDNEEGTIDYVVTMRPELGQPLAVAQSFTLAVITFKAVQGTQSLDVGFSQHPRRSEVALAVVLEDGAELGVHSVLRDLIGFPVVVDLELSLAPAGSFAADVDIVVRPNGNRVTAVDAFLDFPTDNLAVVEIVRGPTLELVLTEDFGSGPGGIGEVDYAAATLRPAPTTQFTLATVRMTGDDLEAGSLIEFQTESPRRSEVAFAGEPLDAIFRGVTVEAPAPAALRNPQRITANNDNTPTFQFDVPIRRPVGGIAAFLVTIDGTGDPAGVGQGTFDAEDPAFGVLECRSAIGFSVDCRVDGEFNFGQVAVLQITLVQPLEDGRYFVSVAVRDSLDTVGEAAIVPPISPPFIVIDTTPPPAPELTEPADAVFVDTTVPQTAWSTSDDPNGLSIVYYNVEVDNNFDFSSPEAAEQRIETFWRVSPALVAGDTYYWRVQAEDDAGEAPDLLGVGEQEAEGGGVLPEQEGTLQEGVQGNEGPFSETLSFVVDVAAPSVPGDLKGISTGQELEGIFYSSSRGPTFQWLRSVDGLVDTGDGGGEVALYRIVVEDGEGTQKSLSEVLDQDEERCGEFTCRFTIPLVEFDGPYNVLVTAVDSAVPDHHESQAAEAQVFVDTVAPEDPPPGTPTLVRQERETPTSPIDATIRWTRAGDPDFPEGGAGVLFYGVSLSPGGFTGRAEHADCSLGVGGNECEVTVQGLSDGLYTVEVEAVDRALKASAPTAGDIFIGDPARPQNLTQEAPLFSDRPVFQWTGPVDILNPIATYEIATADADDPVFPDAAFNPFDDAVLFDCVDFGLNPVACPGDLAETGDEIRVRFRVSLADRNYVVAVRIIDVTGADGVPAILPFTVDITPPSAPTGLILVDAIALREGELVRTGDRFPDFTWVPSTGDQPPGSGFDHYELTIIGDELVDPLVFQISGPVTGSQFQVPVEFGELMVDGTYTASLVAVDVAGRRSRASVVEFIMDLDPPDDPPPLRLRRTSAPDDLSPAFGVDPASDRGAGVDFHQFHVQSVSLVDGVPPPAPELLFSIERQFVKSGGVTLRWAQVPETTAVTYRLEVDSGDETLEFLDIPGTPGMVEFTLPLDTGDYVWTVTATDRGRNVGPASPPSTFRVVVDEEAPTDPVLLAPAGPTTDATPTFVWDPSVDAHGPVTYELQVSAAGAPVINTGGLTETTFTPQQLLAPGLYTWQVKATDALGNSSGEFVAPVGFEVLEDTTRPAAPVLTPPGTADGGAPTLEWTRLEDDNGVTYLLEIASGVDPETTGDQGRFVNPVQVFDGIPDVAEGGTIQFTLPADRALQAGVYTLHVAAVDGVGNTGDFSTSGGLTVLDDITAPAPPVLLSPADGASLSGDGTFTLVWEDVVDPSGVTFELQVSNGEDFSVGNLVIAASGLTGTSFPVAGLADGDYRWWVRGVDGLDNIGEFSEIFTFSLDATAPAEATGLEVAPFVISRQEASGDGRYRPTLVWNSTPDAVSYEVSLASHPDNPQRETVSGDATSVVFPNPVAFGVHHVFRVEAVDASGNRSLSSMFFVDQITGDAETQQPGFALGDEDFLPPGRYNVQATAVDRVAGVLADEDAQLKHASDPAELLCQVGGEVICEVSVRFVPPSVTQTSSTAVTVDLDVVIDALGVLVDRAVISIDVVGATLDGFRSGDGFRVLDTGDGQRLDFDVRFDETTGDKTVVTLTVTTSVGTTSQVSFVNTGGRRTVVKIGGVEVLTNVGAPARITVSAPPPTGGGGGVLPPEEEAEPEPPVISSATVDDPEADEGQTLQFAAAASDPEGGNLVFEWSFGDGTAGAEGSTASHAFADNGTFVVTLTVTDEDDLAATETIQVTVANVAPTVTAVTGPEGIINIGQDVTVTASFGDPGADTHVAIFNWGDGTATEVNPAGSPVSATHEYAEPATYAVTVTVRDDDAGEGEGTLVLTITALPVAVAGADRDSNEGDTVAFDGSASSHSDPARQIVSFAWNFGDGATAEADTATHVYADDGVFTVTLTVTDDAGQVGVDSLIVTVNNVAPGVDQRHRAQGTARQSGYQQRQG